MRIILVLPIVLLLLKEEFDWALLLFVIAGASDAVDGYLARTHGWHSQLGGWLDPLADKTLQVSVYFTLAWMSLVPLWLFTAVIIREAIIITGGLFYYFWVERVDADPSKISKLNTLMQILLVVAIMVNQSTQLYPFSWIQALYYVVLVTIVLSGLNYVFAWGMRAWRAKKGDRGRV